MSQKRVSLSLKEKVDIIRDIEANGNISAVSTRLNKSRTTVQAIWLKKQDILDSYSKTNGNFKKSRKTEFSEMDEALYEWFKIQRNRNIPLSGPILLAKAVEFFG
jgi:hypothetical protein